MPKDQANITADASGSEKKLAGAHSLNRLLGPVEIRELAAQIGVSPTKKLGQNFVHDAGTVRKIVRESGIDATSRVVEVGPGLGSLTLAILETGAQLSAVELDTKIAAALPSTIARFLPEYQNNFALCTGDALLVEGSESLALPPSAKTSADQIAKGYEPTHLVANLPYNVAVPVILTFLEKFPSLQHVLVMVQTEVANRLAAQPGSRTYGVPSAKCAWYALAERSLPISRQVFWPVPNVDSALVRLTRREEVFGDESLRKEVFRLIDAAFAQRRKTLRAALSSWAGSAAQAEKVLLKAGISPQARGEALGITEFRQIALCARQMRAQQEESSGKGEISGKEVERRGKAKELCSSFTVRTVSDKTRVAAQPIATDSLKVKASAPGKINLTLACLGTDQVGYHLLDTIFMAHNLREQVTAQKLPAGKTELSFQLGAGLSSDRAQQQRIEQLALDETNLAWRAADLLRRATKTNYGVRLEITKNVPVAGGMAGGSADAAATLLACNELWQTGLSAAQLRDLGAQLGADVPFTLIGGMARGTHYGETLEPLLPLDLHWVGVILPEGLSTPAVFKHYDSLEVDELLAAKRQRTRRATQSLGTQIQVQPGTDLDRPAGSGGDQAAMLAPYLGNDLQEAAISLYPLIGEVLTQLRKAGALQAMISGSGPTCLALASQAKQAEKMARAITKFARGQGINLSALTLHGSGRGACLEK